MSVAACRRVQQGQADMEVAYGNEDSRGLTITPRLLGGSSGTHEAESSLLPQRVVMTGRSTDWHCRHSQLVPAGPLSGSPAQTPSEEAVDG